MSERLNADNFISHAPELGYFSSVYHLAWTVRFGHIVFAYHGLGPRAHQNELPSSLQLDQANYVLRHLERRDFLHSLDCWIYQFWQTDFDHEYSEEEYKEVGKKITQDNIRRYYRLSQVCTPCRSSSKVSGFFVHLSLHCDWRLMDAEIVLFFTEEFAKCFYIGDFSGVCGDGCENVPDDVLREVYRVESKKSDEDSERFSEG